jgi:uncharacterized protein (TIGR02444 family)
MGSDAGSGRGAAGRESLWRFSLALYARPGVAEALIGLQDRAGCDVNLLLFALWLGATTRRILDAAGLAAAEAAMAPLNTEVVQPLRRLRRQLKGAGDSDLRELHRRILNLELAAERQVQHRLAVTTPDDGHLEPGMMPLAAAEANLALCLGEEAGSGEADVLRQAVAAMIRAI